MARVVGWLAGSVVLLLPCAVMAAPIVGNAKIVVRDVTGSLEHDLRILSVEADVFQDEEVATGANSATRLVFADGTNLTLGEKARLRLTRLVFDGDPSAAQVAIKTAKGVFRWTSGNLRSEAYRIGSPVATIGVRGTTIEWLVEEDGTTTVAVTRGLAFLCNLQRECVDLRPGQSATVFPPDADGRQRPPTEPGGPSAAFRDAMRKLTITVGLADASAQPPAPGANTVANPFADGFDLAGSGLPRSGDGNGFFRGGDLFGFAPFLALAPVGRDLPVSSPAATSLLAVPAVGVGGAHTGLPNLFVPPPVTIPTGVDLGGGVIFVPGGEGGTAFVPGGVDGGIFGPGVEGGGLPSGSSGASTPPAGAAGSADGSSDLPQLPGGNGGSGVGAGGDGVTVKVAEPGTGLLAGVMLLLVAAARRVRVAGRR